MTDLQKIPSVDKLLQTKAFKELIGEFGHPLTVDMLRSTLDQIRAAVLEGKPLPSVESITNQTIQKIEYGVSPTLRPVINASGVIIHTNLGRAPLSK